MSQNSTEHNNQQNGMNINHYMFIIMIMFFIYSFFHAPSPPNDTVHKIMNDKDIAKLNMRSINIGDINNTLDDRYIRNVKLPQNVDELNRSMPPKLIVDELTGNIIVWEVRDHKFKDIWYRTTPEPYEPLLPLWEPKDHNGIYQVRAKKSTEEAYIIKKWNTYLGVEKIKY